MSAVILVSGTSGASGIVSLSGVESYLGRSYTVTARALASINGSEFVKDVPLVAGSGSVTVKAGTGAGRSLTVDVAAGLDDAVVDPYLCEWRVEYGIRLISGQTLWTPVGVFVLTDVKEASRPGHVTVSATDRWVRVADARFERARVTKGDTVAAITALLTEADARITVDATRAIPGSHRSSLWDRDRDKAIAHLARSIGCQVRFDPEGVAVIAPVPALTDPVAWTIRRGRGGAKIRSRAGLTTRRTYNAVSVIGEKPGGDPVYGVARWTDPTSKTRYGGPAGKRPRFYKTSLVTTTAQAVAAASGLLAQSVGVARTLDLETPANPLLDGGHVILVEVHPGVWERHLVDGFPLPLYPAGMSIDTRSSADDEEDEGG